MVFVYRDGHWFVLSLSSIKWDLGIYRFGEVNVHEFKRSNSKRPSTEDLDMIFKLDFSS